MGFVVKKRRCTKLARDRTHFGWLPPPDGGIDLIARRIAEQLAGKLARSVIVDNRPGAAGRIAVDIAKQSPPDGLTLLLNPAGVLTINPHT